MARHTPLDEVPLRVREALIDDWIIRQDYRDILKDRLLNGLTFSELADKYGYSERHLKTIVYKSEETLFKHI